MSITSSVSNTSAQTVNGPHGTQSEINAKSLSPNLSPTLSRAEVRKQIRLARRSLSTEVQAEASFAACRRMLEKLSALKAQHVALYLSHDGELATAPLIEALWQQGIQTYLPRLHPFNAGQLLFLHYHADSPMQPNQFGILEPKLDVRNVMPVERLDVVITPLVAFDIKGNRMGMGGGYYDRTLANWHSKGKPLPMGYAHDCQQVSSLPCEHWDVPLPSIITPSRIWEF